MPGRNKYSSTIATSAIGQSQCRQAGGGGGAVRTGLSPGGGELGCLLISHCYAPKAHAGQRPSPDRVNLSLSASRRVGAVALVDRRGRQTDPVTSSATSSVFAGFRFPREVISLAVRWYLRYGLSYRDVEELLAERGITVDHVTF